MITKNNANNILSIFLISHLIIWTLVPSLTNINLPLDTIEALAWASDLEWGYSKHPPLSAVMVWLVYSVFGSNDWAYYFLSQLIIIFSFYFVWKLSQVFFKDKIFALISVLILEAIVFFNYTSPEFNVYICQLPFKVLTAFYFWKSINDNNFKNWFFLSIFCFLGVMSHYSFFFLIFSLVLYFVFFVKKNNKDIIFFYLAASLFIFLLLPHVLWLIENDLITVKYALSRSAIENKSLLDHFVNPVIFLFKQFGMLSIFILMILTIFSFDKKKFKFKKINKKSLFLIFITLIPIFLVLLVSLITGAKIRTMWMSTFYLFFGILVIYFIQGKIVLKKLRNFYLLFIFIFLLSPITYAYISLSNDLKRTDYPGKEIARLVQNKWDQNFNNNIKIVIGDEWSAGNLSYHLSSRPIWKKELNDLVKEVKDNQGVIYTGNPKILKKICPGVFGTIKPVGYCMIGKK